MIGPVIVECPLPEIDILGARLSERAMARIEYPMTNPREMTSRSANVRARGAR